MVELFVKITGLVSGTTPNRCMYFSKDEASITPGKSLFLNEINRSICPFAKIVCVVLILCRVNSDFSLSISFPAHLSSKAIK